MLDSQYSLNVFNEHTLLFADLGEVPACRRLTKSICHSRVWPDQSILHTSGDRAQWTSGFRIRRHPEVSVENFQCSRSLVPYGGTGSGLLQLKQISRSRPLTVQWLVGRVFSTLRLKV